MYEHRFVQFVNLPKVPDELVTSLPQSLSEFDHKVVHGQYVWSDSFNTEIDTWCKQNICQDMYWAFQFMTGDIPPHCDIPTKTKFVYLLSAGGSHVETCFWDDDAQNILQRYHIPENHWHILKVDSMHSVHGIEPGQVRWSITGKIF